MMIPLAIGLLILNVLVTIIWPNPKLDWINYTATGMLIAAIVYMVMWK